MSYLGNVVGGDIVRYINLPIADLKVGTAGRLGSTSLISIVELFDFRLQGRRTGTG